MWIKAGALVTDLQPALGVIEVYADPIRLPGSRMTHGVGTAFAEGEGEILTNGSRHPSGVEKPEECAPRHSHGPVGRRQLEQDRGNDHTSPKPTRMECTNGRGPGPKAPSHCSTSGLIETSDKACANGVGARPAAHRDDVAAGPRCRAVVSWWW